MFVQDLEHLVWRLRNNDKRAFSLRRLYPQIVGDTLVTQEDYENWVAAAVRDLGLVENLHYRIYSNDIDCVYVRGSTGLNLLLREQNALGEHARLICGCDQVPMRQE